MRCQKAFDDLQEAITQEPILALSYYNKPFQLLADAFDCAIGGVLMQEGHPLAYKSCKQNDTERRYSIHDKEMTAIIHCLRILRHYLFGSRFTITTDKVATRYFQNQMKLTPKQARWQDFLAEFDYVLGYKTGKDNFVANGLSCKAILATSTCSVTNNLIEWIKKGLN